MRKYNFKTLDARIARETQLALLLSAPVDTTLAGRQTAEVWVPKYHCQGRSPIDVSLWVIPMLEANIAAQHPEWGMATFATRGKVKA